MTGLIELIRDTILPLSTRTWLEDAPDDAEFPYVVFRLPASSEMEFREDFILEVTVWGHGPDTTTLETLTHEIDLAINRMRHLDGDMLVSFYRVSRMMIPDPDPQVRRRELRYQAKTYFVP